MADIDEQDDNADDGDEAGGQSPLEVLKGLQTTAPEGKSVAAGLLANLYKGKQDTDTEEKHQMDEYETRAKEARQVLSDARDRLMAKKYDQSQKYFALAAAQGAPTNTGSPGEVLARMATALGQNNQRQHDWEDTRDAQSLQFQQGMGGIDQGLIQARLKMLQTRRTAEDKLLSDSMRAMGSPTSDSANTRNEASANALSALAALRKKQADHPELFRNSMTYGNSMTPDQIQSQIDMIKAGQIAAPTGRNSQTKGGAEILKGLHEQAPEFSATMFPTALAAEKAFTVGAPSTKIRSLNAGVAHLGTLEELGDALKNGETQRANQIYQFLSKETGHAAPTNFKAAADLVGQEIVTAIVPTGASAPERQAAQDKWNAMSSPDQIHGAAETYRNLLGGQFDALEQQYKSAPGYAQKNDFSARFMRPKTLAALKRGAPPTPTTETPPPTNKKGWVLHQDKVTKAYAYVSPDGKQFEEVQ